VLLVLFAALLHWFVAVQWPKYHFPCVQYNCTWAPYNDGGREPDWCFQRDNATECLWGVDIGLGQGFWAWGNVFDGNSGHTPGTEGASITPPYPNPTICYHPPPLNYYDMNYCTEYREPGTPDNWINGWDCMPVFKCVPEEAPGDGLIVFLVVSPVFTGFTLIAIAYWLCKTSDC
jgi:hypothetical protein